MLIESQDTFRICFLNTKNDRVLNWTNLQTLVNVIVCRCTYITFVQHLVLNWHLSK